jgi:hypothetical protein
VRSIWRTAPAKLTSLDIVDADGVHEIVKLKDQLLFPRPNLDGRQRQASRLAPIFWKIFASLESAGD